MEMLIVIIAVALAIGGWIWHERRQRAARQLVRVDHHLIPEVNERVVETDAWEGSFWEVEEPRPVRVHLRIRYRDANDLQTERKIRVHQFGAFGRDRETMLLVAHCELRNEMRTFRADRIEACIDADTGMPIADVIAHLRRAYLATPELARARLEPDEYDALRVLLYLGKAEGLRVADKAIVAEACRKLVRETHVSGELIDRFLRELGAPTVTAFELAANRLAARSPDRRIALMVAAKRLVATQTDTQPVEQQALAYLQQRLFNTGSPMTAVPA